MEVESAVRRYLMSEDALRTFWVDRVYRFRLEETLDGTGKIAAVVSRQPGWAAPDPVKTGEYPVVWVDVYADPTRSAEGDIARLDAADKGLAAYRVMKRLMHGRREVRWGAYGSNPGLLVASCAEWQQPRLITAGDRHASEPALGDMVITRTSWALHTVPES